MGKKFAFLVHPRNTLRSDMGELFGAPFAMVPDAVWSGIFRILPIPPQVTGRLSYGDTPTETSGFIITVPFTPKQLISLPRGKVQSRISWAVDMARDAGAEIVGLGALTAPASAGGKTLAKRSDVGITNGNAFTAAMTLRGIERLMARTKADPLIAFVGATGSVGSCLVELFSRKHSGRVLLVGRNLGRTERLATRIRRDDLQVLSSVDMSDVVQADIVVLLTSAAEALLRSEHLKKGAFVLDDTVPRNTDRRLLQERPDVVIVDGGLVQIPGARLRGPIGLPKGLAYACLAETMLLALEGHEGHFSIGTPSVEQAEFMMNAASRHPQIGFDLAPFRSFGKLLSDDAHTGDVTCAA